MRRISLKQFVTLASVHNFSHFRCPRAEKRNIVDERAALKDALMKWQEEGLKGGEYASGVSIPDMSDLVVFGTLRSVEGLPTHEEFVLAGDEPLKDWYERMDAVMVNHK